MPKEALPMPSGELTGVIGAGSFGTTIATVLARAGRKVVIYARDAACVEEINAHHSNRRFFPDLALPSGIRATTQLNEVCDHATLIFPIIPAKAFRTVLRQMAPHLRAEHVLVHGTKGLERESFKTMSMLIREETCVRLVGAIAGPNLASEIMQGLPSATVVGSRFDEVIALVSAAMASANFLVYGNRDLAGVELGGALKNILAIASGVVDGAGLGTNAKSLLITRGVAELMRCGTHFGADAQTFTGLSGIGDIIATCSSTLSRNYQVGFRLGRGEKLREILAAMTQVAEGVDMTAIVHDYARKNAVSMPLTAGLYALMHGGASLEQVRAEVMRSHAPFEIDRPS
jgi:glycerol-3-phosphate dehydrogenase (NAD(P)+)